ncbi:hypothetical protein B4119_2663 [Parageobacillus caldoxylosilyticus]|uniref:Uncharacterized protein n=1 Tax=Saccharococcus caldoxylosilyticus TaxID=81408 RepID=A0A150LC39_9BACL|nr:hypothetical protein B4119_2663 [Parageobacillus caldoxylosilyticus]
MHAIFVQSITIMTEQGNEPPVWMSGNIIKNGKRTASFLYEENI